MQNLRFPFLLCLILTAPAQADIYKYVDENGTVSFTDVYKKGRQRMPGMPDSPSTLPSGSVDKPQKSAYRNPSPSNFPRIDSSTQRKRDDIRRRVLQDEVDTERQNADEARRQLALGERTQPGERVSDSTYLSRVKKLRDTISQHEQNVSAIQREINNLR